MSLIMATLPEVIGSKFMYFGYGSNLLAKRIHIQNPSAVRKGIGKLNNFQLDFSLFSQRWKGASATIIEQPGATVWGAIWEIDLANMTDLDDQEGVSDNIYKPLSLEIEKESGEKVFCRVYQFVNNPLAIAYNEIRTTEGQPSLTYLNTIIKGAVETGLPETYINWLRSIPNNGNLAEQTLVDQLNED